MGYLSISGIRLILSDYGNIVKTRVTSVGYAGISFLEGGCLIWLKYA